MNNLQKYDLGDIISKTKNSIIYRGIDQKNQSKIIKYIAISILYNQYDLVDYVLKNKRFSKEKILRIDANIKFFKSYSDKSRLLKKIFSTLNRIVDFESETHLFQ